MAPKRALANCGITLFGKNPSWNNKPPSDVSKWLSNLSGTITTGLSDRTTHLVVSKKRWTEDPKPKLVQDALAANAKGKDIKIVMFDWLEDCLNSQSRKREAPYEWLRRDAQTAKITAKGAKAAEKAEKAAAKGVPGMLSEAFHDATDQYVDPVERRKLEKQLQKEKELKEAQDLQEKQDRVERRKEQAKIFGRGAKKARNELLSENHHIYVDTTGFSYDVLVTKVDPRQNRNERWALTIQIYESNDEPSTYCTNTQLSGTSVAAPNNVISVHPGQNFPTAFHAFKSEFKTRTGTEWDERISGHIKRLREEKREAGIGTGSVHASTRGVAVPESATRALEFSEKRFEYHPPGYGPKGEVTGAETERLRQLGVKVTIGGVDAAKSARAPAVVPIAEEIEVGMREVVEEWMRGADMGAAVVPQMTQSEVVEDFDFNAPVNGTAAGAEIDKFVLGEEYPFEKGHDIENHDTAEQDYQNTTQPTHDEGFYDLSAAPAADRNEVGDGNAGAGDGIDWEGLAMDMNMAGDQTWLDDQLAGMQTQSHQHQDRNDSILGVEDGAQDESSMQPEIPSFTTHPTDNTSFQHGTQEIGETQVAEKAGGEFLEEFASEQQPTPPASTKKPAAANEADAGSASSKNSSAGSKVLGGLKSLGGGLNLGSSILGKRKAVAVEGASGESGKEKAARVAEASADS